MVTAIVVSSGLRSEVGALRKGDRQGNSGEVHPGSAQVSQPGLIETVLPAGVFFGTDYEDFARPCDGVTALLKYQSL